MNFVSATDCYTLSNGIKIPCIGYGTFKMPEGENEKKPISSVFNFVKNQQNRLANFVK